MLIKEALGTNAMATGDAIKGSVVDCTVPHDCHPQSAKVSLEINQASYLSQRHQSYRTDSISKQS